MTEETNTDGTMHRDDIPGIYPERSRRKLAPESGNAFPAPRTDLRDYYAYARYYNPQLGRFMSPDPLAGNLRFHKSGGLHRSPDTGPQSLNRYTYVTNNPTNVADPFGLSGMMGICMAAGRQGGGANTADQACGYGPTEGGDGWGGGKGGWGGGCTLDGGDIGCGEVGYFVTPGTTVECPDNACSGWVNGQWVTLVAGAGGAEGYLTIQQMGTMMNECGGSFCSSLGYTVWAILNNQDAAAEQFNAVANALSEKLHIPLAMATAILNTDMSAGLIYLQGGNLNFGLSGANEITLCGGPGGCRLDNGLHIHSVGGAWYVHLDTVDPFESIGDFFEHGFVDLFLGNVAYTITPRPW